MPFFKPRKSSGINAWKVSPSGDYGEDCKMGSAFAIQFLKSCDKTYGWQSLLQCIVADMMREGTDGEFPNGFPTVNGVVIGFMSVIGSAVAYSRVLEQVGTRDGQQGGQD